MSSLEESRRQHAALRAMAEALVTGVFGRPLPAIVDQVMAEAAKLLASGCPAPLYKSDLAQEFEQLLASRADVVEQVDAAGRAALAG